MTGCRVRMGGSCGGGAEGPTPKPRRGVGVERKPVFVRRQEAWHSPGQMEEREPHGKRREKTRSDRRRGHTRGRRHNWTLLDTGLMEKFAHEQNCHNTPVRTTTFSMMRTSPQLCSFPRRSQNINPPPGAKPKRFLGPKLKHRQQEVRPSVCPSP